MQEGLQKGCQEGMQEGLQKGCQEGLQEALRVLSSYIPKKLLYLYDWRMGLPKDSQTASKGKQKDNRTEGPPQGQQNN